jgi:hypothetical protein
MSAIDDYGRQTVDRDHSTQTVDQGKDNAFRGRRGERIFLFRPAGKAAPRGRKESLIQQAARIYIDVNMITEPREFRGTVYETNPPPRDVRTSSMKARRRGFKRSSA